MKKIVFLSLSILFMVLIFSCNSSPAAERIVDIDINGTYESSDSDFNLRYVFTRLDGNNIAGKHYSKNTSDPTNNWEENKGQADYKFKLAYNYAGYAIALRAYNSLVEVVYEIREQGKVIYSWSTIDSSQDISYRKVAVQN